MKKAENLGRGVHFLLNETCDESASETVSRSSLTNLLLKSSIF